MTSTAIENLNLTQDSESAYVSSDGGSPRVSAVKGVEMELAGILNAVGGLGEVIQGLEAALGAALAQARDLEVENAALMARMEGSQVDMGVFQWIYDGVHRVVHVTGCRPSRSLTPLLFGWEMVRGADVHSPHVFKCYDVNKIRQMYQRVPARIEELV